jgi:GT2 family glycosyltransferase
MNYPLVSVIVLNYNGTQYLSGLFNSLEKTDYPFDRMEVIMGDNASTDDSVVLVKERFPRVKILEFEENYGFCKGNNLCVKESQGQYVVFLNTDTLVTSSWLKNLVNAVLEDKTVVVAGPKLLKPYDRNGKKIIDYAGGKITYEINFYEGLYEFDSDAYSVQKYTGFGCGAAVIVSKEFFLRIGGFDDYYFGGAEEVELGLRAWQNGFRVLYVPSSIVYHFRGASFKNMNTFAVYVWVKSMFYFILKNYSAKDIVKYGSESILLTQMPKLIVFLLKRDLSSFSSVVKGSLDFLIELKRKGLLSVIYRKRLQIKNSKTVSDSELAKLGIVSSFSERMRYRLISYQGWRLEL